MSTNTEYAEMTIAKLLIEASARNKRYLERMLYELKSIFKVFYYPRTPECAEVHYKVPVKASARNLCFLKRI